MYQKYNKTCPVCISEKLDYWLCEVGFCSEEHSKIGYERVQNFVKQQPPLVRITF